MIGYAEICYKLYIFEVTDYIEIQPQLIVGKKWSLFIFSSNKDNDILLWYHHLEHPSFFFFLISKVYALKRQNATKYIRSIQGS